jgi:Spy/CpxP family protein refolding chaperone
MSLPPWKSMVGVALVFAIGLLSGAALVVILQARFLRGPDFPERMTGRLQQRLAEDLDLTEAQKHAIAQAMKASSEDVRKLHEEMGPRMDEVFERMRKAVEAELTPEQRQRLEQLRGRRPLLGRVLGGPRFGHFGPPMGGPFDDPGAWEGQAPLPPPDGAPAPGQRRWDGGPGPGRPPRGPAPPPGASPETSPEPPADQPPR